MKMSSYWDGKKQISILPCVILLKNSFYSTEVQIVNKRCNTEIENKRLEILEI